MATDGSGRRVRFGRYSLTEARLRRIVAGLVAVTLVAVTLLVADSIVNRGGLHVGPSPSGAGLLELPIETAPPRGPDLTARENQRTGTDGWVLSLEGKGGAEGYFDDVSVAPGGHIGLHIRSSKPMVNVSIVRLGWYGALGGRLVARWKNVAVASQPEPRLDSKTGMIVAGWSTALTIPIPDDWVSGLYLAVLQPPDGEAQYASFVVREPVPTAPILFVSPVTTHEAYNNWGGKSLYPDQSKGAATVTGGAQAAVVSFDRPFSDFRGAGRVLHWEYPFVRWMEGHGYDVAYATDVDLQRDPSIVQGRKLILFVGHPEYWSRGMRSTLEAAVAAGTNVAFFSANEIYWRVRLGGAGGVAGGLREVTCYRRAALDPLAAVDPQNVTTKWRDPPVAEPEAAVIGEMFAHTVKASGDFVVAAPDHWIYAGTGVRAGDRFTNLIGSEYDRVFPEFAPPGLTILASSPVDANLGRLPEVYGTPAPSQPGDTVQNATIYTARSGATVFAAGTMQWAWALDSWGDPQFNGARTPVDPRVQQITANILDRLGR